MTIVKKVLKVTSGGIGGFFKGYKEDGDIHTSFDVLQSKMFTPREKWFEEEDMNCAKEYLVKNGFDYDEYIVEISFEKV